MHYNMTVWSRDWESFSQSAVGRNAAAGLSDDELVEYLRWMACNRPDKYARLMSAFVKTHEGMHESRMTVA